MSDCVPGDITNFLYSSERVARKTLYLSVVTSMSDTPPQGLDGNPIKVDRCRKNVSLSVPLVRMSAAWWYVGQ